MLDARFVTITLIVIGGGFILLASIFERDKGTKEPYIPILRVLLRIGFPSLIGILPGMFLTLILNSAAASDPLLRRLLEVTISLGFMAGFLNGIYLHAEKKRSFGLTIKRALGGCLLGAVTATIVGVGFQQSTKDIVDLAGTIAPIGTLSGALWIFIPWHDGVKPPAFWRTLPAILCVAILTSFVDTAVDGTFWGKLSSCFTGGSCLLSQRTFPFMAIHILLTSLILFIVSASLMWAVWVLVSDFYPKLLSFLIKYPVIRALLVGIISGIMTRSIVILLQLSLPIIVVMVITGIGSVCGIIAGFAMKLPAHASGPFSTRDIITLVIYFYLILFAYIIPGTLVGNIVPPSDHLALQFNPDYYSSAIIVLSCFVAILVGGGSREMFHWLDETNNTARGSILLFILEFLPYIINVLLTLAPVR